MTLLEKKKIVAEWMGYELIDRLHVKDKNGDYIRDGREWKPEEDRNAWPELWDNMDLNMFEDWKLNMHKHFTNEWADNDFKPDVLNYDKLIIKAHTSIALDALVKAIQQKGSK